MNEVLIIEDEPTLRDSMARGLQKLDGVEVNVAGTLDAALEMIDSKGVDLILSDLDLPGRSGVEIFGELTKRNLRVPIVFLSAYLDAYRASLPPNGAFDVFEKPVSLSELREIVIRKLGSDGVDAKETPFGVLDYVQLACLGRHSVQIHVEIEGDSEGLVIVHHGEIWHAEDLRGSGEEAFERLVFTPDGVRCSAHRGPVPNRTIHESWESLMLRTAARMDEESADPAKREAKNSEDAVLDADLPREESLHRQAEQETEDPAFEELLDLGTEALLSKDYTEALRFFLQAEKMRPGNGLVLTNLERLQAMGITVSDKEEQ